MEGLEVNGMKLVEGIFTLSRMRTWRDWRAMA